MPRRKAGELSFKSLWDHLQPLFFCGFFPPLRFGASVCWMSGSPVYHLVLKYVFRHLESFLKVSYLVFFIACVKLAEVSSADSCYFCTGSWIYTTWSDILFLKLAALSFCPIPFVFSLRSRQVSVALIFNLSGPCTSLTVIRGRNPLFIVLMFNILHII